MTARSAIRWLRQGLSLPFLLETTQYAILLFEKSEIFTEGLRNDGTPHVQDQGRHQMSKILLAEDDDAMRTFLSASLRRAGHDVQDFEDGEGASEALEREVFDLLLTDIVMPGIDGIELARRGAELDPAMKIVFITGFAAVALSGSSPTSAGAELLSKPFHLRELDDEVARVMAAGRRL